MKFPELEIDTTKEPEMATMSPEMRQRVEELFNKENSEFDQATDLLKSLLLTQAKDSPTALTWASAMLNVAVKIFCLVARNKNAEARAGLLALVGNLWDAAEKKIQEELGK